MSLRSAHCKIDAVDHTHPFVERSIANPRLPEFKLAGVTTYEDQVHPGLGVLMTIPGG
jgi:hypothetical protein